MNSKTNHSPARTFVQALIALAMVVTAAVSASPARAAAIPPNDDFYKAVKITSNSFSASITDMTAATTDAADPFLTCDGGGANVGEASLWYTFQPASSGEVKISTAGSGYDTVLTVFKAAYDPSSPPPPTLFDPYSLIEVGCNDDASASATTSALTMALRGGVRYYIEVVRKTGTTSTPPDKMQIAFQYSVKNVAFQLPQAPYFFDATAGVVYYSTGWQTVIDLLGYKSNLKVGNNVGNTATLYFDGTQVEICYKQCPYGNLDAYIDGVYATTIAEGSSVVTINCQDVFAPVTGSVSLLDDNVHTLVLKNAGPSPWGKKVNIDTIQVFSYADSWAPDPITDLVATTGTSTGKVTLKWTAPGDDGMYGRANHYEIRYSLSDFITFPNDWDNATAYTVGVPKPAPAGTQQTITLSNLAPGVTYYFMVVAVDEAGNEGDPSSSISASAVANAPAPVDAGYYDDTSSYWIYSTGWKLVKNSDALHNTLHTGAKVGATASFRFTGTQFQLIYRTGIYQGQMDVYLDGAFLTTINEYNTRVWQRIYVSPILTNGPHSVQFIQNSMPFVNIDAIYISATDDLGPPDPITDLTATQGANDGEVDLTWTATGDDPGGAGTATKYEVRYSTSGPILTEDDWDLALPAPGLIPAPQPSGNGESMTVLGLVPGVNYWFAVLATDDAGYGVLSNTTSAPAGLGAYSYQSSGTYEDSDTFSWIYYGFWSQESYPQASNSDQHNCSPGSSAVFLFTGTGFTLTYEMKPGFTGLKVYVDGVFINQIGQQTPLLTYWQKTRTYSGLSNANHTVQFVCIGKANVDAIEIP